MQDITSSICARTSEGVENQLKDTRDGQLYYVGKMKDGKCWMLQNLALGSTSSATTLTSANSNVTSNWSLPKSYTSAADGDTANITAIQSWNFGKWIPATPLLMAQGCGATSSINNCTTSGLVDVSSSSFQPTYTATTGSWDGANANSSTLVTVNCTSWSGSGYSKICIAGTYDPHYLVGSWYSWGAATAGTGGSSTEASGSICPKGWRLPTGNTTVAGSFGGLMVAYGIKSNTTGATDVVNSPLKFTPSGWVFPSSVRGPGYQGNYWSSTMNTANGEAYNLYFYGSGVSPSSYYKRSVGYSVRCVAE